MQEEHQASTRPVHEKFNEVLKALGTNAYQLSKRLGLTRADKYYKIEKGQAKPSFETIAEIVRFYPQVNVNYYFKDHVPILEEEVDLTAEKPVSVQALRIRHLEQKAAMLEAQNRELLQQLERCLNTRSE